MVTFRRVISFLLLIGVVEDWVSEIGVSSCRAYKAY
jgi:hypothetical protein